MGMGMVLLGTTERFSLLKRNGSEFTLHFQDHRKREKNVFAKLAIFVLFSKTLRRSLNTTDRGKTVFSHLKPRKKGKTRMILKNRKIYIYMKTIISLKRRENEKGRTKKREQTTPAKVKTYRPDRHM